jgi:hypothetical protein
LYVYCGAFRCRWLWLIVVTQFVFLYLVWLNQPAGSPLSAATATHIRPTDRGWSGVFDWLPRELRRIHGL